MLSVQKGLLVLLCTFFVGNAASAAEPYTDGVKERSTGIRDVALSAAGNLAGLCLDSEGRALEGAKVVISQGGQPVAQTTTNHEGAYQFSKLSGGVYQITVGMESHLIRVWPKNLAPPAAKPLLMTIQPGQVMRAQFGGGGGLDLGLIFGVAGLTVGTIAYIEAEEAKDEAAALRQQMSAVPDTLMSP